MPQPLTRRSFLQFALIASGGAAALPLLQACSPSSSAGTGASATAPAGGTASKLAYPTYVPFKGPAPDLPGSTQGITDAYYSFPKNLVKTVTTPPGKGDEMTLFTNPVGGTPPPVEQNPEWQEVNKELNTNFKLNLAGNAQDAATKLSTIVASGDLPDILFLGPVSGGSLANLPDFLNAEAADLTPFLAGDAVKSFPNLANYPTYAWQAPGVAFNNKIYGIPVVRAIMGSDLQVRLDLLNGVDPASIKSADDFKKALQAVTNANAGVYGIADTALTLTPPLAAQIYGAPNNWGLQNGKLVKDYETDQFKAGLSFLRDLWSAGLFHPNSLTYNNVSAGNDFTAGRFVFYYFLHDALTTSWNTTLAAVPTAKLSVIPPFSADGKAKPIYFLGTGNFGASILKKAADDRVKEIIGVLNFFGAPFGSQEDLLLSYGIEGTDFTFDAQNNPIPKANAFTSHPVPWRFMTHGPVVTYNPVQSKAYADMMHAAEQASIPIGVQDATLGLYSATNGKTGPVIKQTVQDGIVGIITSRQPLTDWDGLVKDWQTKGGNQIRDEYQQALAARG